MASLPTGSDKLLEIRTAYIDLIIKYKGKPAVCTWESSAASSSLLVSGSFMVQQAIHCPPSENLSLSCRALLKTVILHRRCHETLHS